MRYCLKNWLFVGEDKASLEALENIEVREDQAWINCHKPGNPNSLPVLISLFVKDDCLQVY